MYCFSVAKLCLTLCNPMNWIMPDSSVLHYLLEFAQIKSIELVMLSKHLILCCSLLFLPSIFPSYQGRWWSRRTCTHLLLQELQNNNSLLNNHQQENIGSHQKNIPHVQGQRRNPSKMIGGVKSRLESNPICSRDAQRAQTNLVHTRTQRPHRDGARTVFECLLQMYRSAVDCCRGRGSGCTRPGYGISPLEGGRH